MKRTMAVMLFTLLVALAAVADEGSRTCGLNTLRGTYGVNISGTRPVPNSPLTESVVGTAIQVFDGAGNFTQTDNLHGSVTGYIPNRPGTGTYTVNADCSGTMTLQNDGIPFALVLSIVVVDNGKEVRTAVVNTLPQRTPIAPIMVESVGRKI